MNASFLYAAPSHDRAGHLRSDPAWLEERLERDPTTRFVVQWQGKFLIAESRAVLVAPDKAGLPTEPILLGLFGEAAIFAAEFGGETPPALAIGEAGEFLDLRAAAPLLQAGDAALLAHAKGLFYWHSRHRFCGVCGNPTEAAEAGHVRRCTNLSCGVTHFPRTDPAVIMLVADGDKVLLGRQKQWPPGQYSVLAGFVEPGETLEHAVAREVLEETGIRITEIRYQGSQPWPFPGSIMLGFRAAAATTDIMVDQRELEAARWVSRRWLLDHPGDPDLRLPPPGSISRALVEDWLRET
jgi:NAD+ diphosphatase